MTNSTMYSLRSIKAFRNGSMQDANDPVVNESSMTIRLNGSDYVTLACSPEAWEELAIGYLIAEGVIKNPLDLQSLRCKDNKIWIETGQPPIENYKLSKFIGTSMGPSKMANDSPLPNCRDNKSVYYADHLLHLVNDLNGKSETFKVTGGTHMAGVGFRDQLLVCYEDIGRHNAVDKTLGYAFMNQLPMEESCLVLSGRVAKEILLKAARSGLPLVLSRAAPTSGSIELAEKLGITIVGFARGDRFNVYTHAERVQIF